MIMRYLFKTLGLGASLAPEPLCIAPLAIAGITAGASILGNLISTHKQVSSQKDSNEAYLKGVRETNHANLELYREQVRDNRLNSALENAYNSPVSQLARFRQAGINNPNVVPEASSIQSATASPMTAPSQTPNPYGNLNIGGMAQDAINSFMSGQKISDTQMSLYQHGIDSALYYQKSLNEINAQIVDIAHKSNLNAQDEENLKKLIFQRETMMDEWKSHMRQLDDLHNESLKRQDEFDVKIDDIKKRFDLDTQKAQTEAKHLSIQDAISMQAQKDSHEISRIEAKRLEGTVKNLVADYQLKQQDYSAKRIAHIWQERFNAMDLEQRKLVQAGLAIQISHAEESSKSLLAQAFRIAFGVDPQSVLGSFFGGTGAALIGK